MYLKIEQPKSDARNDNLQPIKYRMTISIIWVFFESECSSILDEFQKSRWNYFQGLFAKFLFLAENCGTMATGVPIRNALPGNFAMM